MVFADVAPLLPAAAPEIAEALGVSRARANSFLFNACERGRVVRVGSRPFKSRTRSFEIPIYDLVPDESLDVAREWARRRQAIGGLLDVAWMRRAPDLASARCVHVRIHTQIIRDDADELVAQEA